jgi:hypothetical protein
VLLGDVGPGYGPALSWFMCLLPVYEFIHVMYRIRQITDEAENLKLF